MNQALLPAHVLVVDDDRDAVELLRHVLAKDGYRVSAAMSGAEALSQIEASLSSGNPVQLMVLDLLMPAMSGLEVLSRLRSDARFARVAVIVLTAAYSPPQEVAGLEAGADDFIGKPYRPQLLLARVRAVLRVRRAEESLSRAEALSHLIVEGMRDLVFVADARGHFTYVSPSVELLTGYTPDELTSGQITIEWLVHPADYERVQAHAQSTLEGKSIGEVECRIIRKDGTLMWAGMSLAPLHAPPSMELQGILRDMTARRQTEEALRSRNEELAALNLLAQRIGESLDPQVMLSEVLDVLMDAVNAEFGTLYTLEDDRLCVRAWRGLLVPVPVEADPPDIVQQLCLSEIQVYRERASENTGRIPSVAKSADVQSCTSLPLHDRGQLVGLLVLASRNYDRFDAAEIDFLAAASKQIALGLRNTQLFAETQRRAKELELINQVSRAVSSTLNQQTVLETIMNQAIQVFRVEAGSVLLLDKPDGDLVFAVAAGSSGEQLRGTRVPVASSVAGLAVREGRSLIIGDAQHDEHFYHQVDRLSGLTTQKLLVVPLRVHGRIIGVLELVNKLDEEFTSADVALLEALAGSAATAIENARLYEEALRHAEEIQRSQAQLIRSEKLAATGRLAISLAHEINNPLQAVQNLLHLSLDYQINDAKRREFLEMAREETSRLIVLIQQTLEFYRPAQSQTGPMDVNATIARVLALTRKKLEHSNVEVELKLAENLAPVKGAPDQVAQVFLNLIVNAAEAMSEGGHLRIESRADADYVQVTFVDTGPGVALEDLPHVFEPFYTTKASGTGLGLAVSYNIIESHGGTLGVESIPGQGAMFTVRLPAHRGPPALAEQPTPARRRKKKRET